MIDPDYGEHRIRGEKVSHAAFERFIQSNPLVRHAAPFFTSEQGRQLYLSGRDQDPDIPTCAPAAPFLSSLLERP